MMKTSLTKTLLSGESTNETSFKYYLLTLLQFSLFPGIAQFITQMESFFCVDVRLKSGMCYVPMTNIRENTIEKKVYSCDYFRSISASWRTRDKQVPCRRRDRDWNVSVLVCHRGESCTAVCTNTLGVLLNADSASVGLG